MMAFSLSSPPSTSSSYSHSSFDDDGSGSKVVEHVLPLHHRSRRRTSSSSSALPIERSMQVCSDAESVRRVKQTAGYHTVLTRNAQLITASDLMISDDDIPLTRICEQFIYDYVVCVKMKNPSHSMASMVECGRSLSCEAMQLYLNDYDDHTNKDGINSVGDVNDKQRQQQQQQQQLDDHPYQSLHGALGICESCTKTRRFFIRYNVLNWAESIKSQFHAAESTRRRAPTGAHCTAASRSHSALPLLPSRIAVAATQPVGMFFKPDTKLGDIKNRQSNASFPQSYPGQDHAFSSGLLLYEHERGEETAAAATEDSLPSPLLLPAIPSSAWSSSLSPLPPPPPPPLYLVGIIDDFEMRIDGANSHVMRSAHAPRVRNSQLSFDGCTIPIRVIIKSMQLLKTSASSSSTSTTVVSSSLESSPSSLLSPRRQQQQQRKGPTIASLSRGNLRRLDRAALHVAVRDSISMTLQNVITQSMVISDQENELNPVHGARASHVIRSRITPPFPGVCDFGDMEITIH